MGLWQHDNHRYRRLELVYCASSLCFMTQTSALYLVSSVSIFVNNVYTCEDIKGGGASDSKRCKSLLVASKRYFSQRPLSSRQVARSSLLGHQEISFPKIR